MWPSRNQLDLFRDFDSLAVRRLHESPWYTATEGASMHWLQGSCQKKWRSYQVGRCYDEEKKNHLHFIKPWLCIHNFICIGRYFKLWYNNIVIAKLFFFSFFLEMKGVASVFPSQVRNLHTTRSWNFLGFPTTARRNIEGERDVIVGLLDTGNKIPGAVFANGLCWAGRRLVLDRPDLTWIHPNGPETEMG